MAGLGPHGRIQLLIVVASPVVAQGSRAQAQ